MGGKGNVPMSVILWCNKANIFKVTISLIFLPHTLIFIVSPAFCIFAPIALPFFSFPYEIPLFSLLPLAQFPASHSQHHQLSLFLDIHFFTRLSFADFSSSSSIHIWIPLSSPPLHSLSSLTRLSISLYLSNLLLSSHVPATLPEAVLSGCWRNCS